MKHANQLTFSYHICVAVVNLTLIDLPGLTKIAVGEYHHQLDSPDVAARLIAVIFPRTLCSDSAWFL